MSGARYDRLFAESADSVYGRGLLAQHADFLIRQASPCRQSREDSRQSRRVFVEIGCNTGGLLTQFLQALDVSVVGVDINHAALQKAAQLGHEVLEATAGRLPFPDDCVDVLVALHTLEHIAELRLALKEFARVLRPDGRALLVVPLNLWGLETIVIANKNLPPSRRGLLSAWRYARKLHCSPLGGPLGGSRQHLQRMLDENGIGLLAHGGWRWEILANFLTLDRYVKIPG